MAEITTVLDPLTASSTTKAKHNPPISTGIIKEGYLTVKKEDILYVDARLQNKQTNGDSVLHIHLKANELVIKCKLSELNLV